jgi:AGZA family xanthine/uracil permease-like MFS transporter
MLDVSDLAFKANFDFYASAAYVLPLFFISHIFDAVATSLTLIRQAYFTDIRVEVTGNEIDNKLATSSVVRDILVVDSIFVVISGILGSGPTTPFIESAVGISVGARTGLAAVVSGLLFLISIFLAPIIPYIVPGEATGPALLTTAILGAPFLQSNSKSKNKNFLIYFLRS